MLVCTNSKYTQPVQSNYMLNYTTLYTQKPGMLLNRDRYKQNICTTLSYHCMFVTGPIATAIVYLLEPLESQ